MDESVRLKRLAARIDALVEKDEESIRHSREIAAQRRAAAAALHAICAQFVGSLNALASKAQVSLDPDQFGPDAFSDHSPNLLQLNARGRIIQIEFHATDVLVSTEEFRIPYILQGEVRCFNQELLDRQSVEEQLLFYCLEKGGPLWRFFDARTYRSGPFDQSFLVSLMEQLV